MKNPHQFWNNRYQEKPAVYGYQPNAWVKEYLDNHPPGQALFPAEGQGRNVVYAASKGWMVDAFDFSSEARRSALAWAKTNAVLINYEVQNISDFKVIPNQYDAIILCFLHLPEQERKVFHTKLIKSLKIGGHLVMEAFSKTQLAHDSGGPQAEWLLYELNSIQDDFSSLKSLYLKEQYIMLSEGSYHQGKAHVVRYLGQKEN